MASDFARTVELLNQHFHTHMTLVEFDSKTPQQLVALLQEVLELVSADQKRDPNLDERTISARQADFVRVVLAFKPPITDSQLAEALLNGDKDIIIPLIQHVLQSLPTMQERAYLARYVRALVVPEDCLTDPAIVETYKAYRELIATFKATHAELREARKGGGADVEGLIGQVKAAQEENEGLRDRIRALETANSRAINYKKMLEACSSFINERNDAARLQEGKDDQQRLLQTAEMLHGQTAERVRAFRDSHRVKEPEALFQSLQDEVNTNKFVVEDRLRKEAQAHVTRIRLLQKVLRERAPSAEEQQSMQMDVRRLRLEINGLRERNGGDSSSDGDAQFLRNQQVLLESRKNQLRKEIADLETQVRESSNASLSASLPAPAKPLVAMPTGPELAQYLQTVRQKIHRKERLNAKINDVRKEYAVLHTTEQILQKRDSNLQEYLSQLERQRGVEGFRETQDDIERVSGLKAELDEINGRTLEDISRMVSEMNRKIAERKSILEPKVTRAEELKRMIGQLASEHAASHTAYKNANAGFELEFTRVQTETKKAAADVNAEESKLHGLYSRIHITSALAAQCAKGTALVERYQRHLRQLEDEGEALRSNHRTIKTTLESDTRQLQLFGDLKALLNAKLS
eukprot:gnl/Spiro4/28604_TR14148_c0_g1_i1.p1 gnl/Spiro4/28604_TR14148_c0_g1~~gnl/Spiro4/28604_TR14148_c0_g1_i1.p1  ORF type:complete len:654 (+),score=135.87 gnl/Spiro4/28604_TR14148_c0_g1_i1:60-1964(+)